MWCIFLKGPEKRILIIGKVGAGKSAVGNAIIQDKKCFESRQRLRPVTEKLQSCRTIINDESYYVVDTPGVKGEKQNHKEAMNHLTRSVLATAPGFHCIVFVFSAMQRLEGCDIDFFKEFEELLGEDVYDYMIITRNSKHPHYIHEMYNKAYKLLNLDAKLIEKSKTITKELALEEARDNALKGLSPNDAKMLELVKKYKCCTIF